jgi:hypothetical protein
VSETVIVVVRNIDPALAATYGPYMHVTEEKARKGEARGKWQIVQKATRETRTVGSAHHPGLTADMLRALPGLPRLARSEARRTKVAWVQDNEPGFLGGAEISGERVAAVGDECGFRVRMVTPKAFDLEALFGAEVIVLNNLFRFPDDKFHAILSAIRERRIPYVKYEHDHRELDREEFSRRLFQGSALNVFLSPMHLENHRARLGAGGVALPLAVDADKFYPVPGVERIAGTALVCNVRHFKTWENLNRFITERQDLAFTILGPPGTVAGKNVHYQPMVPPDRMPLVYSTHEYVVHLLDGFGAGERVVLEGALCGCKVIANEKVGHASWGRELADNDGFREWLLEAPYRFWRAVDLAIRGKG